MTYTPMPLRHHIPAISASGDLPNVAPDDVLILLLGYFGVPSIFLLVLTLIFAALGWKSFAEKAGESYMRASTFIRQSKIGVAWKLPALMAAQIIFLATAYSITQILPAIDRSRNNLSLMPTGLRDLLEVAFTWHTDVSVATKSVLFVAIAIIAAIDFLAITVRADALEHAFGASVFAGYGFGAFTVLTAFLGFFSSLSTSQDSGGVVKSSINAFYVAAVLWALCGASLCASTYSARSLAEAVEN